MEIDKILCLIMIGAILFICIAAYLIKNDFPIRRKLDAESVEVIRFLLTNPDKKPTDMREGFTTQ